jgi:hypothetical protein
MTSNVGWKQFLEQTELMTSFLMAATNVSEKVPAADFEGYTSEGEKTSTRRGLSIEPKTKAAGCFGSKVGRNVLNHLIFEAIGFSIEVNRSGNNAF